jgi:predicted nucleotidyltransferase
VKVANISKVTHLGAVALRKRIQSLIEAALGPDLDEVYLFGFRARGDAGLESDWDVLVMVHKNAEWCKTRSEMRRLTAFFNTIRASNVFGIMQRS